MKNVFNFVLWVATMSVILGAHFTAIPILVTIATAIYWIVSILLTIIVSVFIIVFCSKLKEEVLDKTWNSLSNTRAALSIAQGVVSASIYALVGWAWPFAMVLIFIVTFISSRLNKE